MNPSNKSLIKRISIIVVQSCCRCVGSNTVVVKLSRVWRCEWCWSLEGSGNPNDPPASALSSRNANRGSIHTLSEARGEAISDTCIRLANKMLERFEIFTTSGVVLWSRSNSGAGASTINTLINDVFIEDKVRPTSQTSTHPTVQLDKYTLKYELVKDLGLIFVVG